MKTPKVGEKFKIHLYWSNKLAEVTAINAFTYDYGDGDIQHMTVEFQNKKRIAVFYDEKTKTWEAVDGSASI